MWKSKLRKSRLNDIFTSKTQNDSQLKILSIAHMYTFASAHFTTNYQHSNLKRWDKSIQARRSLLCARVICMALHGTTWHDLTKPLTEGDLLKVIFVDLRYLIARSCSSKKTRVNLNGFSANWFASLATKEFHFS